MRRRTSASPWSTASGDEFEVKLTDYSRGIQASVGSTQRHILLNGFRIPLSAFVGKVDLSSLDRVELRFGGAGVNATGAIQLADIAFQELGGPDAPESVTLDAADAPTTPLPTDPVLPKVDAVLTSAPGLATAAGKCVDMTAPSVSLRKVAGSSALSLSGKSADAGCVASGAKGASPGSVKRVQVTLALKSSGGKCRYVLGKGSLSKSLSCKSPISVIANGTTTWKLRTKRLKRGSYTIAVRAIDGAGNLSPAASRRVRIG